MALILKSVSAITKRRFNFRSLWNKCCNVINSSRLGGHIGLTELHRHWFRIKFVTCSAPSHYLGKFLLIVDVALKPNLIEFDTIGGVPFAVPRLPASSSKRCTVGGHFQSAGAARSLSFSGKMAECDNDIQDCTGEEFHKQNFRFASILKQWRSHGITGKKRASLWQYVSDRTGRVLLIQNMQQYARK